MHYCVISFSKGSNFSRFQFYNTYAAPRKSVLINPENLQMLVTEHLCTFSLFGKTEAVNEIIRNHQKPLKMENPLSQKNGSNMFSLTTSI